MEGLHEGGQPGILAIIPIVNTFFMIKIAGLQWWFFLLLLVPIVGFFVSLFVMFKLAEAFGKGAGFAIGLIILPFIFIPILAFGDAEYQLG